LINAAETKTSGELKMAYLPIYRAGTANKAASGNIVSLKALSN
jgi:hypothetical protein